MVLLPPTIPPASRGAAAQRRRMLSAPALPSVGAIPAKRGKSFAFVGRSASAGVTDTTVAESEIAERLALLRGVKLMHDFTERQLTAVALALVERWYEDGELLIVEGDESKGLFVLQEGEVLVFRTTNAELGTQARWREKCRTPTIKLSKSMQAKIMQKVPPQNRDFAR